MAKKRVTVYFATNRQPMLEDGSEQIINFSDSLGPTGGLDVRYGVAQVDVDIAGKTTMVVPGSPRVAGENQVPAANESRLLGSDTIFEAIRSDMAGQERPTLAFIHGFSNTFFDGVARAGWNLEFLKLDANVFVFSWPSRGTLLGIPAAFTDYSHDRATAEASGPAVARTIRRLHDFVDKLSRERQCNEKIHLLCHSMGNYVLRHALQALMQLPNPSQDPNSLMDAPTSGGPNPSVLRKTFSQIVLAAPDEDADAFDDPRKLKFLPRTGEAVTVYHSSKDWVLSTLSAITKFNGPRLGNEGPDNMSSISDKVSAIDAGAVADFAADPQAHQYYRTIPAVAADIAAVINGTPQGSVPNRVARGSARWAIKPPARRGRG
ncbi:MAG: alpha/beta fold hydrolase [Pseudolabrys sp.]